MRGPIRPPPLRSREPYGRFRWGKRHSISLIANYKIRFRKCQKSANLGFRGAKIKIAVFSPMFRNVITSLFLERFRPNFRTSFSINKSIHTFKFLQFHKSCKNTESWQTCPRESGPGGASAQSRNSKIWYNIPNECLGKVKKFKVPILSRFP